MYIYIYICILYIYIYIDRRTSIICSINSRPYRPLIRSFAYSPIRSRIRSQRSIGACCSCANLQNFLFSPLTSDPPIPPRLSTCPPPILFSPPQIAGPINLGRGWEDVGRRIRPLSSRIVNRNRAKSASRGRKTIRTILNGIFSLLSGSH